MCNFRFPLIYVWVSYLDFSVDETLEFESVGLENVLSRKEKCKMRKNKWRNFIHLEK